MMIDTHTHLTDEKFMDIGQVIDRSVVNGVRKMIVPTTSIKDLKRAIDLSQKFNEVFVLAGVHPEEIDTVNEVDQMIQELRLIILKEEKIVGIGEIGLDFYWDKEKKGLRKQVEIFKSQLELAVELNLPVAIHMREAESEVLEVLHGMRTVPRGQFHCFSGSEEFLRKVIDWGFYVSFAGNITYKSAGILRDRLKQVPIERLLLETDSPYLAPEPVRGSVNEPANVKIVAKFIAEELNLTPEKISEITQKNTLCLYSLDTL